MQLITRYSIPKFNIPSEKFFKTNPVYTTNTIQGARPGFFAYEITNKELGDELKQFFKWSQRSNNFLIWVQQITPEFNGWIHYDPRMFALNYIIDPGGSEVTTNFYDSDHKLLTSKILESDVWYGLRTEMNHSVNNIKTIRTILSLTFVKYTAEQKIFFDKFKV